METATVLTWKRTFSRKVLKDGSLRCKRDQCGRTKNGRFKQALQKENPSTTAAACTTLRWACHNGNGYRSHMEADFFPEGFKGWQPSLQKGPMRPDKKRPVQTSPTKREPLYDGRRLHHIEVGLS